MEDDSPQDAFGGWPLNVDFNPPTEFTTSMRLRCSIDNDDFNGESDFFSNIFSVGYQC